MTHVQLVDNFDPRNLIQGSTEWRTYRCGKFTASRAAEAVAKTKNGWGTSRASYMSELLAERLTGIPTERPVTGPMQWGTFTEPEARKTYEEHVGLRVECVGFVPHLSIDMAGCSPDGLIDQNGELQIKCPNTATHIDLMLGKSVPDKYITQIQFGLACTGRHWCDFVSYDPRVPDIMRLFIERVERDEDKISYLEKCAREFLDELEHKISILKHGHHETLMTELRRSR